MADEIAKVGLGVDLLGGEDVLTNLRAIRAEMAAIAQLGGRGGSSTGTIGGTSQSAYSVDEKAHDKYIDTVKRKRTDANRSISDAEIKAEAQSILRRQELRRRANDYLINQEKATQAELTRIENDAANRRQAQREQRQLRIKSYSQIEGIADRDLGAERRQFRKYRGDPARDEQTNIFRRQLAEEVQGQRIAIRERTKVQQEEETLNKKVEAERQRQLNRARNAEVERRSNDPRILARNIDPRQIAGLPANLRNDIELDYKAQQLAKRRQLEQQDAIQFKAESEARKARDSQKKRETNSYLASQQRGFEIDNAQLTIQAKAQNKTIQDIAKSRLVENAPDAQLRDYRRIESEKAEATRRQTELANARATVLNQASSRSAKQVAEAQLRAAAPDAQLRDYQNISQRRRTAQDDVVKLSQLRTEAVETNAPRRALQQIEREQEKAIALYKQLAVVEKNYLDGTQSGIGFGGGGGIRPPTPGGPSGPRGPRREGANFEQQAQALNPRGFFTTADVLGRITRNILLYEVVSRASYGLVDYIGKSVTAAKTTVEFANALRFATESAGGNVEENTKLADSLGPIGLSRQQGRAAVTEAVRFAENRPQDTGRLLNIVTNIAAERGGGIDRTDELIEQLRRRESKFYKRIFGKTVESIYTDEASKVIDSQTTSIEGNRGLYKGLAPSEYKSRTELIKQYVAQMDDAGKEQAVFNYILSQESKFAGEAAERANTLAGRIDKVNAALLNGQEGLGLFITDLKTVRDIMDYLGNKAGILDKLRPATLGRTGQQGTISNYDVQQFGTQNAYGPRANALRTIDSLAAPVGVGIAALGTLNFLGKRTATIAAQREAYEGVMQTVTTKFKGDLGAATQAAVYEAQNAKAGLVRQVGAGLTRVSSSIAARVNDLLYTASDAVGLDNVARGAARRAGQYRGQLGFTGPSRVPVTEEVQQAGQTAGGLGGGIVGAYLGSLVADKITSNQIFAAGITIAGGIAGTAVGTAAGQGVTTYLGNKLAQGGGGLLGGGTGGAIAAGAAFVPAAIALASAIAIGIGGGNLVERFASGSFGGGKGKTASEQAVAFEAETKRAGAYREQVKERFQLIEDNRIRYRSTTVGGPTGLLTGEQVRARGDQIGKVGGGLQNYAEVIVAPLTEAQKKIEEFRKSRDQLVESINKNDVLPERIKALRIDEANRTFAQQEFDERNPEWKKFIDGYRARQAESIDKRLAKDKVEADKDRNEYVSQVGNAFSKLRDAQQGSFRLPGDIAQTITGDENPYTKVLADQVTIAERMRQQWGFLGDAAVKYFSTLEQGAASRNLNKLEFQTYTAASNLRGQAEREADTRSGPGLSRREQEYLDIQNAIVERATQIPQLWSQAADILRLEANAYGRAFNGLTGDQLLTRQIGLIGDAFGVNIPGKRNVYGQDLTPDKFIRNANGQVVGNAFDLAGPRTNLLGQSLVDPKITSLLGNLGAGQSPEVANAVRKSFAETLLDAFKGFSPQQIKAAGYQDLFLGSLSIQRGSLGFNIDQARRKAEYGAKEDERLQRQLEADDEFRKAQLSKGYDAKNVGRESDSLLLARTEGVNPKDLSLAQFTARQDALRRNAERQEQDRTDAKEAVAQGLKYQKAMAETIEKIREAILSGDLSMLVQVQNDTQAKVDQSSLQEIASGKYRVPLDQGQSKSNPYTNLNDVYGKGGRK